MENMLTSVNNQAVSAIAQANMSVLGLAPAMAMGSLYQNLSNAAGMMAMNAVYAQQQSNMIHQAATVQGILAMYGRR
jgi:hypothetical protein